jgi:hypothetical protein
MIAGFKAIIWFINLSMVVLIVGSLIWIFSLLYSVK